MPAGAAYLREERMRLANLIAAASLWTERRRPEADDSGTAAAQTDSAMALRELDYDRHIRDIAGDAIHRRFQIHPEAVRRAGESGGVYSNAVQDVEAEFAVLIGYDFGAGDSTLGDLAQCAEVAMGDAETLRQKVEHPGNRTAGTTGIEYSAGVTGGRTVRVIWEGTRLIRDDVQKRRFLVEIRLRSQLRVTTEVA